MPDIQDVENSIVALIAATLFPNVSPYKPSTVANDGNGNKYRVYRGWPQGDIIESDAKLGITDISVASIPNTFRNTSRILSDWYSIPPPAPPSMSVSVSGSVITFTGTPAVGLVVGVVYNRVGYRYQIQPSDTIQTITSIFAEHIPYAVTASGSLVLVAGPCSAAVIFNTTTVYKETSRQTMHDRITVWAPTNDQRDSISSIIANVFADTPFLTVGVSSARFISDNMTNVDDAIQSSIFRRDLIYMIEWPTLLVRQAPNLAFPVMTPDFPAGKMTSIVDIQS